MESEIRMTGGRPGNQGQLQEEKARRKKLAVGLSPDRAMLRDITAK